jgi:hypothetical protein
LDIGENMNRTAGTITSVILSLLISTVTYAGGWTKKKGEGFYKLGFQYIRAKYFYEPSGNRVPITPLGDYTTSLYIEYGIEDWLTAVGYIPFYKYNTLDRVVGRSSGTEYFGGDKASGFADPDVGLRVALIRNTPTVLALGVSVGIPVGNSKQPNGLLSGDGEFNQAVSLQAGHSFYPLPMYVTADIGFNNRTRGYSDELLYAAQIGYTFEMLFNLAASFRGVKSLKNGDDAVTGGTNGIFTNNQTYLEYGGEAGYRLTQSLGISAGVYSVAGGRNVLSAPKFTLGLSISM